jgi:hypothetical protein
MPCKAAVINKNIFLKKTSTDDNIFLKKTSTDYNMLKKTSTINHVRHEARFESAVVMLV